MGKEKKRERDHSQSDSKKKENGRYNKRKCSNTELTY
jgi:hypothetical protein